MQPFSCEKVLDSDRNSWAIMHLDLCLYTADGIDREILSLWVKNLLLKGLGFSQILFNVLMLIIKLKGSTKRCNRLWCTLCLSYWNNTGWFLLFLFLSYWRAIRLFYSYSPVFISVFTVCGVMARRCRGKGKGMGSF